jgi:hypothetical protein
MIRSHLLYPTELSCWHNRLDSNQLPPGHPGALPLSYDRLFVQRNTKPQSGPRQPGSHEPGHMAERRAASMQRLERKRNGLNASSSKQNCAVASMPQMNAENERRGAVLRPNISFLEAPPAQALPPERRASAYAVAAEPCTARRSAACASKRVESSVGSGEFASFMINGISVQPRMTASQPSCFIRPKVR